jgi:hypothetical protein
LEEKRLIAALIEIGLAGLPLPPTDSPLPIQPLSGNPVGGKRSLSTAHVVIDRLMDRTTAAVLAPYWRSSGWQMIDGGAAASLDRLAVSRLLVEAGIPRPETALVLSETSGLEALESFGGVGTLLPLRPGTEELPLLDREIAEAVLEHRQVLGQGPDAISLMQQGVGSADNRSVVTVVDGVAIATAGSITGADVRRVGCLAEETARILGATLLGVTVVGIEGRPVVWDVAAAPQFRMAKPQGELTVEAAVANLVSRMMDGVTSGVNAGQAAMFSAEVTQDVVLSA